MSNVLLLEPDRVLSRTYAAALEHAGYRVAYAHAAQDAIHVADDFLPAVAIIELQLAAHDGIEFLHELRSYPEWQGIPIIINTNVLPQTLAAYERALRQDLGVTVCLYKPRTSLQQLLRVVNEQLLQVMSMSGEPGDSLAAKGQGAA